MISVTFYFERKKKKQFIEKKDNKRIICKQMRVRPVVTHQKVPGFMPTINKKMSKLEKNH